jgi:hypothetical protein
MILRLYFISTAKFLLDRSLEEMRKRVQPPYLLVPFLHVGDEGVQLIAESEGLVED